MRAPFGKLADGTYDFGIGEGLRDEQVGPEAEGRFTIFALTQLMGKEAKAPAVTVTTTREVLVGLIVGKVSVADAITSGVLGIDGDRAVIEDLFDMLDTFGMQFDILTPGPGVPGPD